MARWKSLVVCAGSLSPLSTSLPGTSSDLATSRTRLVPAGPSGALLGIKGGIRQKGGTSSPGSPAWRVGAGGGWPCPPSPREGVPKLPPAPFPMDPRLLPGLPEGWRGCQFPGEPRATGAFPMTLPALSPRRLSRVWLDFFSHLRFPCASLSVFNNSLSQMPRALALPCPAQVSPGRRWRGWAEEKKLLVSHPIHGWWGREGGRKGSTSPIIWKNLRNGYCSLKECEGG